MRNVKKYSLNYENNRLGGCYNQSISYLYPKLAKLKKRMKFCERDEL